MPASVHVKLFEDVTNHDHLRVAKQPVPAQRALAELQRQQRQQQAVLRQRTNPAVPRYAHPCSVRPQTAPSDHPTPRGQPGATGYAAATRPSQQRRRPSAPAAAAERTQLPSAKAPSKAPSADPYALDYAGAPAATHRNPRLGEAEKEILHRQALLRRLMREPKTAAHAAPPGPLSSRPVSTGRSLTAIRPVSASPPPGSPKAAFVGSPDMYRHEKVLGKGAFGLVSLVRSVLSGELVAMKTIDRSKLYTANLKKTVAHESRILHHSTV